MSSRARDNSLEPREWVSTRRHLDRHHPNLIAELCHRCVPSARNRHGYDERTGAFGSTLQRRRERAGHRSEEHVVDGSVVRVRGLRQRRHVGTRYGDLPTRPSRGVERTLGRSSNRAHT